MSIRELFQIQENIQIAKDTYKMILQGNTENIKKPGQFINIKIEGLYLRRPISVCDYDQNTITIIYKIIGAGTEKISNMREGEQLDILTGLGNGYNTDCEGNSPLLIAGGVGVPPMYKLSKELIRSGKKPIVVLGFKSKEDIFFKKEFENLGLEVLISTEDGSQGTKGFLSEKDLLRHGKEHRPRYRQNSQLHLLSVLIGARAPS